MSYLTAIKSIADIVARLDERLNDKEARNFVEGHSSEQAAQYGR